MKESPKKLGSIIPYIPWNNRDIEAMEKVWIVAMGPQDIGTSIQEREVP